MTDYNFNVAVVWFVLGFVLFLLEFVVPGLVLFFFGIGAWVVACLCLAFDLSINYQLIIFIASSGLNLLLFRKWIKTKLGIGKHSTELMDDEFLGKIGKAETSIIPGEKGKVDFKGTTWDATSEELVEKGDNVVIVGNDSIILKVKKQAAVSAI